MKVNVAFTGAGYPGRFMDTAGNLVTAATTPPEDRETTGPADKVTTLSGRFMLPDFSEHPCQVSQLSADGAVFDVALLPPPGLAILAYIDGIGRVEGRCAGPAGAGFAIAFTHSGARRSRLEKRLKRLSETRFDHGDRKLRRAELDVSHIALADGRTYPCEVMDITLTGAAVKTDITPTLGTHLMLGRMRGRVVRYIDHGVAIEFVRPTDKATQTVDPSQP